MTTHSMLLILRVKSELAFTTFIAKGRQDLASEKQKKAKTFFILNYFLISMQGTMKLKFF
jgi:hypothetical protein